MISLCFWSGCRPLNGLKEEVGARRGAKEGGSEEGETGPEPVTEELRQLLLSQLEYYFSP
jgi:hypothetical protein